MRNIIQIAASLWKHTAGGLKKVDSGDPLTKRLVPVVDNAFKLKLRIFLRDLKIVMENSASTLHPSLKPPSCIHGMTELQKEKFVKNVKVPGIKLPKKQMNAKLKAIKPFLLKLRHLSPVGELAKDDPERDTHNLVLLDPATLDDKALSGDIKKKLNDFEYNPSEKYEIELNYDNWSAAEVLKTILPKESDGVTSFTQIGHIVHLNLKPENMPYKNVIGQVILDKIGSVKTVVNKLNTIDNTYRNFEMELLAGENNFITQTKEHNCVFELDFSKVYWNSRLSTEHQRIVNAVERDSIVYDVFAGVGPFAIPLAKRKGCKVFANDLNPNSFHFLERNAVLNKIKAESIQTHNLDGSEFIKTIVKSDLLKRLYDFQSKASGESDKEEKSNESIKDTSKVSIVSHESTNQKSYAVMNLPALAVDFLNSFDSLLSDLPAHICNKKLMDDILPEVFCYAFCSKSGDFEEEVKERAQEVLKQPLPPDASVRIVRNVSPNKEMVCLSFKLWSDLVLGQKKESNDFTTSSSNAVQAEPVAKKQKLTP